MLPKPTVLLLQIAGFNTDTQKSSKCVLAISFAAGVFHGTAAAGVAFLAVVDGAYNCYYNKAGYGDYGDYC